MSRKLKSYGLFAVLLILLGILVYLLKDIKTGNKTTASEDNSNILHDAQYYNHLGIEYSKKRNYEEALKAFNKSIELSKNTKYYYIPYTGRSILKYRFKDCDGTINDAKIAITSKDLSPTDRGDMFGLLGACEAVAGNYKESVSHLAVAISLEDKDDPDLWMAFLYKGASELYLNNLEDSIRDFNSALKLNPNDIFVYDSIYKNYMNVKDYKTASIYFEKMSRFSEGRDHFYYENGIIIYMQLFYSARDINDTKNTEIYGNLFLENANMANKLMPNAKNGYWLCLVNNELKLGNWMNVCQEALAKAKQEKNDEVYKDISDIMK